MTRIHFVSENRGKARVFAECVAAAGFTAEHVALSLVEPQTDTVEAVALAKAQQAFAQLRAPLVVEDSGFCVDALAGFPGPYTKYALATIGVAGLLRLAAALPSRSCRFVAALVHVDGDGAMTTFLDDRGAGALALEVDDTPCPEAWSALWSVFIPAGTTRPIVALSPAERVALWTQWHSHSVYAQLARWLAPSVGQRPPP